MNVPRWPLSAGGDFFVFSTKQVKIPEGNDNPAWRSIVRGDFVLKTRLKEILLERGIKQKWLCERVGLSYSALNQVVNGQAFPTLETALRIAKTLQTTVEDIWYLDE